jgi:hypothetical protein
MRVQRVKDGERLKSIPFILPVVSGSLSAAFGRADFETINSECYCMGSS